MAEAAPFFADLAQAPPPLRCERIESAGARLRAAYWRGNGRGLALVLHGRTEYLEKYGRVIARLLGAGFSVASADWRGQGLSERTPGAGMLGDVAHFDLYQRDLAALLAWAPVAADRAPRFALAHSMGGAVAMRAIMRGALAPRAAIFSAPMWGLNLSLPAALAGRLMAAAAVRLGLGLAPVPGQDPDTPYVLREPFESNVLTSCPEHYEWMRAHLRARPELGVTAPTMRWAHAAFREMAFIRRAPVPDTPFLALLGSEEKVVSPEAVELCVERSGARIERLNGARHEVLMEPFDRAPGLHAWHAMQAFLNAAGF